MSSEATIAWRKYESAFDRLRMLHDQLAGGKAADTLGKLQIEIACKDRRESDVFSIGTVSKALAEAVQADMGKYVSGLLIGAQDSVRAAADDLRAALDRDLKSNIMRD